MRRPPRPVAGSVFTPRFLALLTSIGAMLVTVALVVGSGTDDVVAQRTRIFLTLGLGQLAVAWTLRSRSRGLPLSSRSLPLMVVLAGSLMLVASQASLLHPLLGTVALGWPALVAAAACALVPAVLLSRLLRLSAAFGDTSSVSDG